MSNSAGSRRSFLRIIVGSALAGTVFTMLASAIRFLKPVANASDYTWLDLGSINEISGDSPVARKVTAEQVAGWAKSREEHLVYVLPHHNHQILSAICPHEGCEVSWRSDERLFACPCHESNFTAEGTRLNGPSPRGLDPLPSRVENGRLQVQYQFFVNNTKERMTRG